MKRTQAGALASNSGDVDELLKRATILQSQGDYDRAWSSFAKAQAFDPDNQDAILGKFECEQQVGAKCVYATVDLKLTAAGEMKILEFGALQSGTQGLQNSGGQEITALLGDVVQAHGLPPIHLASDPGRIGSDNTAMKEFSARLPEHDSSFPFRSLAAHSLVYGANEKLNMEGNKSVLALGDAVLHFIFANKTYVHLLFEREGLLTFHPKTWHFNQRSVQTIADKVLQEAPAVEHFVLKDPVLDSGEGVVVVERTALKALLATLFSGDSSHPECNTEQVSAKLKNHIQLGYPFMIQEYVKGKVIESEGKHYDPTMRVLLLFARDNEEVRVIPFASYWKLPPQPIAVGDSLRSSRVSSYNEEHHAAAKVSLADQEKVFAELGQILPPFLDTAMKENLFDEQNTLGAHYQALDVSPIARLNYWWQAGGLLLNHGQYALAQCCAAKLANLQSNRVAICAAISVRALLNIAQGEYKHAITLLDTLIELQPMIGEYFLWRAKAKNLLGIDALDDDMISAERNGVSLREIQLTLYPSMLDNQCYKFDEHIVLLHACAQAATGELLMMRDLEEQSTFATVLQQQRQQILARMVQLGVTNINPELLTSFVGAAYGFCGIGEFLAKLMGHIVPRGYHHLSVVSIQDKDGQQKMQLVWLIVDVAATSCLGTLTHFDGIDDFFSQLPETVIIMDLFSGSCFRVSTCDKLCRQQLALCEVVVQSFHLGDLSTKKIVRYQKIAGAVLNIMSANQPELDAGVIVPLTTRVKKIDVLKLYTGLKNSRITFFVQQGETPVVAICSDDDSQQVIRTVQDQCLSRSKIVSSF